MASRKSCRVGPDRICTSPGRLAQGLDSRSLERETCLFVPILALCIFRRTARWPDFTAPP